MTLPLAPFGPRRARGMVAAADQAAVTAGLAVLEEGGSAADAAVATGAAMAVVGPHMSGLGGDVLAMVSPPGSAPRALLGVGRAGSGADAARLREEGMTTMPVRNDIRRPRKCPARSTAGWRCTSGSGAYRSRRCSLRRFSWLRRASRRR